VLAQEDLLSRRDEALTRVFRFLGVDEGFRSECFSATYNTARERMVQRALNRVTRGRVNVSGSPLWRVVSHPFGGSRLSSPDRLSGRT
jgi:hypothetical protein